MTELDRDTRWAYGLSAPAWAAGPERVYRHLAAALLRASPAPPAGALLLDVGAGTGALADVASAKGARCVEVDVAAAMLAQPRPDRVRHGVAADGRRLPFADATFDAVTAGCSLSHVDDPATMLAEIRRVLRTGGVVLASTFPASGTSHPVRACVEEVLEEFGYRRAAWYRQLSSVREAQVDTAGALEGLARAAQFTQVTARAVTVDTGISAPEHLVDYRLGVAQHAEFLAGLDAGDRDSIRATAIARLGAAPPALIIDLLVLSAVAA
jgi:ubiquinone/menaquinone biosynthesis C-methylase UbiE